MPALRALSPAVVRTLSRKLEAGATLTDAAAAAGIAYDTLTRWLELARKGHPQLRDLARAGSLQRRATRLSREREAADVSSLALAMVRRQEQTDAEVARERAVATAAARLIADGASVREAARRLRIHRDTLRTLVKRGRRTGAKHLAPLVAAAGARESARHDHCPRCGRPYAGRAA